LRGANIFGARLGTPSALYVVNVETGATRHLTAGDAVQPNWSPGGRRIAYWGLHRGGQRDLWTKTFLSSGATARGCVN
jgi:Tol biopolymer transport system component